MINLNKLIQPIIFSFLFALLAFLAGDYLESKIWDLIGNGLVSLAANLLVIGAILNQFTKIPIRIWQILLDALSLILFLIAFYVGQTADIGAAWIIGIAISVFVLSFPGLKSK